MIQSPQITYRFGIIAVKIPANILIKKTDMGREVVPFLQSEFRGGGEGGGHL